MNEMLKAVGKHLDEAEVIYHDLMHGVIFSGTIKGIIKGLPEDIEERERACATLAVTTAYCIENETYTVETNIDDLYYAVEIFRVYIASRKFEALGAVKLLDEKDEYGFPKGVVTNIEMLKKLKGD